MKYLLQNPKTGKWLSDGVEVDEPDDATRLFTSQRAATECARVLSAQNKRLNAMYTTAMFPERYDVVGFVMVQI